MNYKSIDCFYTPEKNNFCKFHPLMHHQRYRSVKISITLKIDGDLIAWLRQDEKGYQIRLYAVPCRIPWLMLNNEGS